MNGCILEAIRSKKSVIFPVIFILLFPTAITLAQSTLEPQEVTAYNDDDLCGLTDEHIRATIRFYNVGAAGGDQYAQVVYSKPTYTYDMSSDECTVTGTMELIGTYSGGTDGTMTFPEDNELAITGCRVVGGSSIICDYAAPAYSSYWDWEFTIENPEVFTPTTNQDQVIGQACSPVVSGLSPAKVGDVISPSTEYVDAAGKPVGIIQERWYINGQETPSVVWDGKAVALELQYTCLDHLAAVKNYSIPAYQEAAPAAEAGSANPQTDANEGGTAKPPLMTTGGFLIILSGLLGVLGAVGTGIGFAVKNKGERLMTAPPAPVIPPAQQVNPPGVPTGYTPQPAQPAQSPAAQRAELLNIRGQMQGEMERIKARWRANRDAVEKLTRLKKKNMIKFMIKKGFDVQQWVTDSPVEMINNLTIDPVMEKVMGKHDTSQDGSIIVQINNRIQSLQQEMRSQIDEVKYLQNEISKIDKKLR